MWTACVFAEATSTETEMLTTKQDAFGFHQLKDICDNVEGLKCRLDCILASFGRFLEQTVKTIQSRSQGANVFRLDRSGLRSGFGPQSQDEIKLERSLAHHRKVCDDREGWFLSETCKGFQSFQVPTSTSDTEEWGDIDLIGVSNSGRPQVWELKQGKNTRHSPFHMVLQSLAYGLVVRNAWTNGLRAEWLSAVNMDDQSDQLEELELFCLAPTEYWRNAKRKWITTPGLGSHLVQLVELCRKAYFPVRFVMFDAEITKEASIVPVSFGREIPLADLIS